MRTRRERRIKHRRARRIVATLTAVGAVDLGVGFAVPANARNGNSNEGCSWSYWNGVSNGTSGNSGGTSGSTSNYRWC